MKFLIASLKTLTVLACSHWAIFSNGHSQPAFGTTFDDIGGCQKAETSSLKRVTGRNFTISKLFHRRKQKLNFYFNHKKKKIGKTISTHSESIVSIFRTIKKYSYRDTVPLRSKTEMNKDIFL
jgi:hypothetical protein